MYSVVHEGKVLDFKFKKFLNVYHFYVGDIYVGQIHKMHRGWAIIGKTPNPLCPIYGFRTRMDGCEVLLKMERIGRCTQNN